jgi:enoyl-CoA hydratase/carnithine racemase
MATATLELETYETFLWEYEDHILTVTLNRPDRLNALSRQLQDELRSFWPFVTQLSDVRVVILTGAGRAFSAGADTGDLTAGTRPSRHAGPSTLNWCPGRVVEVPVIAAINGMCIGGALNFLADADVAIASESAWFSDPHVTQGQVSGPEPYLLSSKSSYRTVLQMALCGSALRLPANAALTAGLVTEVIAPDQLLERARQLATMIAAQSPTAVRASLAIMREKIRLQTGEGMERAWTAVTVQWDHPDCMEGPAAFVEKREPRWADPLASASPSA